VRSNRMRWVRVSVKRYFMSDTPVCRTNWTANPLSL
jgi:hypothetical protein